MSRWTLADVPWEHFDPNKVDSDTLRIVKAASMVEYNGDDYATYLCSVLADDPDFHEVARNWAKEEVQHGVALAKWAKMADPSFDFDGAFKRFTDGYSFPLDATQSVRGSRSGEFVARCIVEIGTSSFYAALGDSTNEPVLKAICEKISADEVRHYKMFRTHLGRYLVREKIGFLRRLWIAIGRLKETEDDELAFAYFAANDIDEPYDRKKYVDAYVALVFPRYKLRHVERGISMLLKTVGVRHRGWLSRWISRGAYRYLAHRGRHAQAV